MRSRKAKMVLLLAVSLGATFALGGCGFKSIALGLLSETLNGGGTLTSLLGQVTGST